MSLVRLRRERREHGAKLKRGMSPFRLFLLLVLVGLLIWWLSSRG